MFDILAKLLMHRQLKFEAGKIQLLDQRIAMLPVNTVINIQKKLEKYGLENIIYYAGKETGVEWFANLYKTFKIKRKDVIKWGFNVINLAGWGSPNIIKMDIKNEIILFSLKDAAVAGVFGPSDNAVDHYFRGCAASAGNLLFETDCEAIEMKCMAQGHKQCEFIVKPRSNLDNNNPILQKQLNIPNK